MRPNGRIQVISYLVGFLLVFGVIAGCSSPAQGTVASAGDTKSIVLATTTSTQDSGLLDVILPVFEKQSGIQVKVVAVGTGQAIQLGKDGNADVLLVHARKDEDDFVASGYGVNAYDVMFNQFLLVGPKEDPAGVKGMTSAADAVKAIAAAKAAFISRGDDSGTHKKELSIWKTAGLKPEGPWYFSAGQGMGATLQMADEKNAYTLTDEATYLSNKGSLVVLKEGDPTLLNPYGVIQVKSSGKAEYGETFIQFLVGPDGQKLIGEFGKADYGKGLFVPNAKKR
ncbi:substrate-binding domain-containing protein [Paenibacillus sp. tmac-D7]|uniref:substrate-binding domain-containing protein n=1 Tax=Paenibacillus sp. tmac-D7 TaxID=2591462 RepID=UPI0011422A31|nr:substrate-binding domain-containing protein [Paenibacillus sp. tmac-D7]